MYQKLYHILFNAITDALKELEEEKCWSAKEILKKAQWTAEEVYLQAEDEEDEGE